MKITLTIGGAPHYETGLVSGLMGRNLAIDVIGGDDLKEALSGKEGVSYKNLYGAARPNSSRWIKLTRVAGVYLKLIKYAATTDSKLFHIQWPYKLVLLDRTLLHFYYKLLGKKIIFTAHNVNADARDGTSTWSRHASLRYFYQHVDHLIVHTQKMREQLVKDFAVPEKRISVIPHGVMSTVPETALTGSEARQKLGLKPGERVVLFFGLITPYKGLETLVEAFGKLVRDGKDYKLVIAGRVKECPDYWKKIEGLIKSYGLEDHILTDLRHVPDEDVEIYLKAGDVMVLPYRDIFQSGALFLSYRFGLPVIATDVGSFREEIEAAQCGFICKPNDPASLAQAIEKYFASDLFQNQTAHRQRIRAYAEEHYSWRRIGELTKNLYQEVLGS